LQEDEYLLLVRLLLAQSRQPTDLVPLRLEKPFAVADALLKKIEQNARDTHRTGRLLEVLLLQALVLQQVSSVSQAVERFDAFLNGLRELLGEPEGRASPTVTVEPTLTTTPASGQAPTLQPMVTVIPLATPSSTP
jgi:hypothetical protein